MHALTGKTPGKDKYVREEKSKRRFGRDKLTILYVALSNVFTHTHLQIEFPENLLEDFKG